LIAVVNCKPAAFLVSCLVALSSGAEPLRAARPGADHARTLAVGSAISMEEAVRIVEQRFHARVVKAQAQNANGRTVYVLKLLDDSGRVWTVHVDAANGSLQQAQ